jgi:hypothetical protein
MFAAERDEFSNVIKDLSFPKIISVHSDGAIWKERRVMIAPHLWIARRNGASFSKAKCVRDSL